MLYLIPKVTCNIPGGTKGGRHTPSGSDDRDKCRDHKLRQRKRQRLLDSRQTIVVFDVENVAFDVENDVFDAKNAVFDVEKRRFQHRTYVFDVEQNVLDVENDVCNMENCVFDVEKRTAVQRVGEAPPATSEARRRVNNDDDDDGGGMMNDGCVHNDVLSIFLIQKHLFFSIQNLDSTLLRIHLS